MSSSDQESPKPIRSATTDQSTKQEEYIDFRLAYALQNNNIRLQDADRSRTEEIIEILSKFSTKIQKWKNKWHKFYTDEQENITDCENIWRLFDRSTSSIDVYIEKINHITDNLQKVRDGMLESKENQTLEFKINQARAHVDKLDSRINELKEKKKNLKIRSQGSKDTVSNNLLNCIKPQLRPEDFTQRQTSVDASIRNMKNSLKKEKKLFQIKQKTFYEDYKKDELERCRLLKEQLNAFVKSFRINSKNFDKLLEKYNQENDFNRWEQKIFHQRNNKSCTSLSENDGSSDDDQ